MEHNVNLHVCESGGVAFNPCYSHGDFFPAIEMYLADYVDDSRMISLRYDYLMFVYVVNFYVSGWISTP